MLPLRSIAMPPIQRVLVSGAKVPSSNSDLARIAGGAPWPGSKPLPKIAAPVVVGVPGLKLNCAHLIAPCSLGPSTTWLTTMVTRAGAPVGKARAVARYMMWVPNASSGEVEPACGTSVKRGTKGCAGAIRAGVAEKVLVAGAAQFRHRSQNRYSAVSKSKCTNSGQAPAGATTWPSRWAEEMPKASRPPKRTIAAGWPASILSRSTAIAAAPRNRGRR